MKIWEKIQVSIEEEHNSLEAILTRNGLALPKKTENQDNASIDGTIIHKSGIINFEFDFYKTFEWFENLMGIKKLAVGILLGNALFFLQ